MTVRWPVPDFVRRPRPVPWLGWAVLAVGTAVFATALGDFLDQQQALDRDRGDVAALDRRLASASSTARTATSTATSSTKLSPDSMRALRRVEEQLQRPWERVLQGLEQAGVPGVRWLTLEIDGDGARVRAEGLSPNAEVALSVVDALAVNAGWSDVVLTRLQSAETVGGAPGAAMAERSTDQRFEVAARWNPATSLPDMVSTLRAQRP